MFTFLLLFIMFGLLINLPEVFRPWVVIVGALLVGLAYLPTFFEHGYLQMLKRQEPIDWSFFRIVPKDRQHVYATDNKLKYILYRMAKILLIARSLDISESTIQNYDYQETGSKTDRSGS